MSKFDMRQFYESALAVAVDDVKKIKSSSICPIHKRKSISIVTDYDNDGTCAHLSKYCCPEFAQSVAQKLKKAKLFDHIRIEDK